MNEEEPLEGTLIVSTEQEITGANEVVAQIKLHDQLPPRYLMGTLELAQSLQYDNPAQTKVLRELDRFRESANKGSYMT